MTSQEVIITAAVVQTARALVLHAEGWMFESQDRQPLVVKTGSNSSTARQQVRVSRVSGDDHYIRMPRVTVGVAR